MKRQLRKGKWTVFAVLILAAACQDKSAQIKPPAPAVMVTISEAKATDASYFDEYPGTVASLNQTEIRAQVTGYVTGIYFKDGAKVRKGQRLYAIDQQLYNAQYQQSLANLKVQETNLEKVQKDAERYHELDRHDAIAKQQVDYADAALEAAKKQVEAAKASLKAAQAAVGFASIEAPFTGTVGISLVRLGSSVVAGQTVLNTISTDNPMAVDFSVDQKEVYRFSQILQSKKQADSVFALSFSGEVYPYPGTISLIDRAVDPQTGTIRVRLIFPNEKQLLRPGMTTTVRVLNNANTKTITIPYKAVTEQLGEYFVYVLGDSNKVSQRKVSVGRQMEKNIIIRDGLSDGDKIVVEGVQNLREGSLVTVAADNENK